MAVITDAARERRLHDERVLVERLTDGDNRAFEQLYTSYEGRLYGFCHRVTGNPHDAADIVQETFVRAIARFSEIEIATLNVGAYLFATARNLAYKTIERQQRVELDGDLDARLGSSADADTQPEVHLLIDEQRGEVQKASLRLAPRQRAALALRDLEGYSYGEIAAVLELNQNAVAQLISRARIRLREELRMTQIDQRAFAEECRERLPVISAYLDGHLREAQRLELEGHLSGCADCRAALAAFEETAKRYRAILPAIPLAGLAERTRDAVRANGARTVSLNGPSTGFTALKAILVSASIKQPIAALAVAAALVTGGVGVAASVAQRGGESRAAFTQIGETPPTHGGTAPLAPAATSRPATAPGSGSAPSTSTTSTDVGSGAPGAGAESGGTPPTTGSGTDPTLTGGDPGATPTGTVPVSVGTLAVRSIHFPTRAGDPLTVTIESTGGRSQPTRVEVATSDPDLAPTSRAVPALDAGERLRLTFACDNYRGRITASLADGSVAEAAVDGTCP